MNLFHWHLTEYYGWRLESKRHPELAKDSSFYLRYVGKYYTQDEFREIVDYAHARGITVMPEFDVPGHALAFRRAFGFETMRDAGVRAILCDLVDELCSLAPARKMPFFHGGGVNGRLLPRGDDARLARAADLERRVAAQRDKVWADWHYPFQFLKQTDMRWRVSTPDGTLVAKDVAQATLFFWQNACQGAEGAEQAVGERNLFTNRTGVAIAETWIRSPRDQCVGAWIGFTDYTRNHGRAYSAPTPARGQWSRYDAQVELNGEKVPPPAWRKPGQRAGTDVEHLLYMHELDEIAFADEEYYMREPTPIRLRKGWNHVKLTVPMKTRAANHQPWVATFIPLLGTTAHPQEVPGLEYRSDPPDNGWL